MSPKIVDKEEKRNHILEAAIKVFARIGLPNSKMIQIAEAAGIGKGTIYEYFKSKEDLSAAAFNVFVAEAQIRIAKRLNRVDDPVEKLREYLLSWTDLMDEGFMMYADIMLDIWAESVRLHEGDDVFGLNRMYRNHRTQIAEILNEGVATGVFKPIDTTVQAAILIGALDGLMLQWILDRDLFGIEPALHQLTDLIVDGTLRKDGNRCDCRP